MIIFLVLFTESINLLICDNECNHGEREREREREKERERERERRKKSDDERWM